MFNDVEKVYIESSSTLFKYKYLILGIILLVAFTLIIWSILGFKNIFGIFVLIFVMICVILRIISYYMVVEPKGLKQILFIGGNYKQKIYEQVKNDLREKLDKNGMYNIETIKVLEKYYMKEEKKKNLNINDVISISVALGTFFYNPNLYEQIQILIFVLPVLSFFISKFILELCLDNVINNRINNTILNKIFNEYLIELINKK